MWKRNRVKPLKATLLGVFYESLGFMLQSGVTVKDCAVMLKEDPSHAIRQDVLDLIIDGCNDGQSFCEIVKNNPCLGPYWRQISIAERTGQLPECIVRISKQIRDSGDIQRKIRMALVQPAVILILGILICVYLMNTVVAQIGDMLTEFDAEMPTITLILMRTQAQIIKFWPLDIAIALVIYIGLRALIRGPLAMSVAHFIVLFKATSGVSINSNYALVYRLLHDMIVTGSHTVEALRIAASACTNKYIQHELYDAADEIESEGVSLATALAKVKSMPPQDKMLVKVGLDSGHVREILDQIASHRSTIAGELVNSVSELISPIATVFTGIFVTVIMLGVTLPMINLTNAI